MHIFGAHVSFNLYNICIYMCNQAPTKFILLIPCTISLLCWGWVINIYTSLQSVSRYRVENSRTNFARQRKIMLSSHEVEVDAKNRFALDRAYWIILLNPSKPAALPRLLSSNMHQLKCRYKSDRIFYCFKNVSKFIILICVWRVTWANIWFKIDQSTNNLMISRIELGRYV